MHSGFNIEGGSVSNSYYLNTCGATGAGTSMTAEAMKTADFVTTLNTNAASPRATYPDIVLWKGTPGSTFPTFVHHDACLRTSPQADGHISRRVL